MQEQVIKLCNQLSNTLSVVYSAPQCRLQLEITSQVNPVQCLLQVYERRAKMEDNQAVIYITRIIVIMIKVLFKDQAGVVFLCLISSGFNSNWIISKYTDFAFATWLPIHAHLCTETFT